MPEFNAADNRFFRPTLAILALLAALTASGNGNAATQIFSRENAVVLAVRKVSPAVVNISSELVVRNRANPFRRFGMDPFFEEFFRDFFDPGWERQRKRTSLGSGVIIDGKRGFILTNAHVIHKTGDITVRLKDERELQAQIVGADPDSDLAVLQIQSEQPLPAIEMGASDDLMIGETVIAIGNPFGFSHTVTTGVISAINRSIRTDERMFHDFIQIDASINPGNSGGPLLNINGELIGINTAIYAKAQGIGFAIPIKKARRIINDLIAHGEVIPAWLGLTVQGLNEQLANYLKLPSPQGVMVKRVDSGSPAAKAGIQAQDIILNIGKRSIKSKDDYQNTLRDYADGDVVPMKLWRGGYQISLSVKAAVFPEAKAEELAYRLLGVKVSNASLSKRSGADGKGVEGVVIADLDPDSFLFNIGARPGDLIRQIDEQRIRDVDDFKKAVIKSREKSSVVVLLQRGEQGYYITVEL